MDELYKRKLLVGEELRRAINEAPKERKVLIDGFLYEDSIIMYFADDGLGKSVLSMQVAVQASAGSPVFGGLAVPSPLNVVYVVAERTMHEPLERIRFMSANTPVKYENLAVYTGLQGFNMLKEEHHTKALECLREVIGTLNGGKVDVVVLDPVYALCSGELKSDEATSMITSFTRKIQLTFGCAIILVHHTNRGGRNSEGERTDGDMYGNRFLSAHLTGRYHLKKNHEGVTMTAGKDSHDNLIDKVQLRFDRETFLSYLADEGFTSNDKVMVYINSKKGQTFTFNEISRVINGVCNRSLRYALNAQVKKGVLTVSKSNGKATLYKVGVS